MDHPYFLQDNRLSKLCEAHEGMNGKKQFPLLALFQLLASCVLRSGKSRLWMFSMQDILGLLGLDERGWRRGMEKTQAKKLRDCVGFGRLATPWQSNTYNNCSAVLYSSWQKRIDIIIQSNTWVCTRMTRRHSRLRAARATCDSFELSNQVKTRRQ